MEAQGHQDPGLRTIDVGLPNDSGVQLRALREREARPKRVEATVSTFNESPSE